MVSKVHEVYRRRLSHKYHELNAQVLPTGGGCAFGESERRRRGARQSDASGLLSIWQ